jgi:hypothetical protein
MGCREVTGDKDLGLRVRDGFASAGDGMVGEVRGKAGLRWTDGGRGSSKVGRRGGSRQLQPAGVAEAAVATHDARGPVWFGPIIGPVHP